MNSRTHIADDLDESDVIPLSGMDDVIPLDPRHRNGSLRREKRAGAAADSSSEEPPQSVEELSSLLNNITIEDSGEIDLGPILLPGGKPQAKRLEQVASPPPPQQQQPSSLPTNGHATIPAPQSVVPVPYPVPYVQMPQPQSHPHPQPLPAPSSA